MFANQLRARLSRAVGAVPRALKVRASAVAAPAIVKATMVVTVPVASLVPIAVMATAVHAAVTVSVRHGGVLAVSAVRQTRHFGARADTNR